MWPFNTIQLRPFRSQFKHSNLIQLGEIFSVVNLGNRDILVSSMGLEHIEFYEQFKDDCEYLRFLFMADFKADSHLRSDSAVAAGLHNRFLRPGHPPVSEAHEYPCSLPWDLVSMKSISATYNPEPPLKLLHLNSYNSLPLLNPSVEFYTPT